MRSSLLTLAVGFFTLAESVPTPPENDTSSALLISRADPSGKVHWTIHETCYTGDDADNKKKAVLDSVKIITDRSALAVESLEKWKKECRGIMSHIPSTVKDIRANCELLLSIDKWEAMIDTGIKFLRASSEIQGPIGGADSTFEKSGDWNNLKNGGEHYNNFIIYCAPDLEPRKNDAGRDQDWDKGQDRWYDGTTLKQFRDAWEQDKDKAPEEIDIAATHAAAITLINDPAFIDRESGEPIAERKMYAGTITLNPSKLRKESASGYNVDRITEAALAKAMNAKDLPNGIGQIEVLVGLPGLIHHEMFHTWGLGRLKDDDDLKRSYGWDAMVTNKDQNLPEYFMYLGLLMDLTLWGARVTPEGNLERMKK
ncbi:hypothetical protein V8F33_010346 [Rhypophila sp. PSN 637]